MPAPAPATRSVAAVLLAVSLAQPAPLAAAVQEPAAAAPAVPAAAAIAGGWEGWARLTNDWPGLGCRYEGGPDAVSVRVELAGDAGALRGSAAIDLPAAAGSGCPPLRKRYQIREVALGPGTAAFVDSGGNEWTLSVRRSGSVLQGLLAWQPGGTEQPLADGFALPGGVRPLARLGGEVRLVRAAVAEGSAARSAAAAGTGSAPAGGGALPQGGPGPTRVSAGRHAAHVAAILGANVVGLGLLYGANKLGKGSSSAGAVSCSPRFCHVGAPNAPCLCPGNSANLVSGASCGTTTAGRQLNEPCNDTDQPCASGLSCNSNVCEDQAGRCPY